MAMKVEYAKAQLAEEWQEENEKTDSRESIHEWAGRQLTLPKPEAESAEEFEVRFRALGSWAGVRKQSQALQERGPKCFTARERECTIMLTFLAQR